MKRKDLGYIKCRFCGRKHNFEKTLLCPDRRKREYKIKLKCGCIYNVFAEDKGHANCQVDYLHYIDVERDKIKNCRRTSFCKFFTRIK